MKPIANKFFLLTILISQYCLSQNGINPWKEVSTNQYSSKTNSSNAFLVEVVKHKTYSLDYEMLKKTFANAPDENQTKAKLDKAPIILLPTPDGGFKKYRVIKRSNLAPKLSQKFPEIQSYVAINKDNDKDVVRIATNKYGINILAPNNNKSYVIEHLNNNSDKYRAFYRKDANYEVEKALCGNKEVSKSEIKRSSKVPNQNGFEDGTLRTFRIALATTAEHSAYHIEAAGVENGTENEKKAAVLSALNAYLDRVNEVYEREFSIRFQLVANNDKLIFLDTATDGYDSNNSSQVSNETQRKVLEIIGDDNFDIGHGLCTTGGGIAGLNVVCTRRKAGAASGSRGRGLNPNSNGFISTFLHELGHQFGAGHAQNVNVQRSENGAAVELGCGTTIMSYAGAACDPQIQNIASFHFNAYSHKEINAHINRVVSGESGPFFPAAKCGVIITENENRAPILSEIAKTYTIPQGTPFALTAEATDVNSNDVLTYTWEQMDDGEGTVPPDSTNTISPLFVSYDPTTSSTRYFPRLSKVLEGELSSRFEVLPTVAREMNFTVTVRDNSALSGQTDFEDVVVNTTAQGPFKVTSQNEGGLSFDVSSEVTVTWDVAGTTANGINTENVSILLSTNGGISFDKVLSESTPNDGSQKVQLLAEGGKDCRLMVKAVENIFFAVNAQSFSIGFTCENEITETEIAISDSSRFSGVTTSVLNVTNETSISGIEIFVNIEHSRQNTLKLDLRHPDGQTITLWNSDNCSFSGGTLNTIFSDNGKVIPQNNCRNLTDRFVQPRESLLVLDGKKTNGEWRLIVNDQSFDGRSGIIKSWGIKFCTEKLNPVLSVPTPVKDLNKNGLIKAQIYPSPNNGVFRVKVSERLLNTPFKLSVYDLNGRIVLKRIVNNNEQTISVKELSPGIYISQIEFEKEESVRVVTKFVIK